MKNGNITLTNLKRSGRQETYKPINERWIDINGNMHQTKPKWRLECEYTVKNISDSDLLKFMVMGSENAPVKLQPHSDSSVSYQMWVDVEPASYEGIIGSSEIKIKLIGVNELDKLPFVANYRSVGVRRKIGIV